MEKEVEEREEGNEDDIERLRKGKSRKKSRGREKQKGEGKKQ